MGIANKVCDFFEFWYYQYILVTALYMLEFWERAVFSILTSRKTIVAIREPRVTACPKRPHNPCNCKTAVLTPNPTLFYEDHGV